MMKKRNVRSRQRELEGIVSMEPLTIDLRKVGKSVLQALVDDLPAFVEDAEDNLQDVSLNERVRRFNSAGILTAASYRRLGRTIRTARRQGADAGEARVWHRCLMDVVEQLRKSDPLLVLRTPAECCAFTTIVEHAFDDGDGDTEYLLDFVDAIADDRLLPDCASPLCAWADFDEYRPDSYGIELDEVVDVCEAVLPDEGACAARPAIRHPMRTWSVTVTLEYEIDRSGHDCDPAVCPLEVTAKKRVTWKRLAARTKSQAEDCALTLFSRHHRVRDGSYGAQSHLLKVPPVIAVDEHGHDRVHRWHHMISGRQGAWRCVCGSTHEDSP